MTDESSSSSSRAPAVQSDKIDESEVFGLRRTISVTSFNSDDNDKNDQYESAPGSLLVKYKNQLFDVYDFLQEHPGGRLLLENYANKVRELCKKRMQSIADDYICICVCIYIYYNVKYI